MIKETYQKVIPALKDKLGLANALALPKLEKVIVSAAFGKQKDDKDRVKVVEDRLAKITGQKPSMRNAKQSIAGFKLREGQKIGAQVTMRGSRMYDFLDMLVHVAIPRERDFRGIKRAAIDEMGNLTIGFKEHTIFPATSDEDLKDIFGFAVTIVTSAKDRDSAYELLSAIGVPFKKEEK